MSDLDPISRRVRDVTGHGVYIWPCCATAYKLSVNTMDDGNSITTRLLTLLNVSATKIGKRKRVEEDFIPSEKLNKRKSTEPNTIFSEEKENEGAKQEGIVPAANGEDEEMGDEVGDADPDCSSQSQNS